MKKYLAPVIVAGFLCGNLALCETERKDIIFESTELNEEFVYHYEMMIKYEERNPEELMIIREGYRGFLSWQAEEFYDSDPEARKLIEE